MITIYHKCTDVKISGVCVCDDGYSGVTCDISKATVPRVATVPYLCDISQTEDCKAASVFGVDFVESTSLTCRYEFISVSRSFPSFNVPNTQGSCSLSVNGKLCQQYRAESAYLSAQHYPFPAGSTQDHILLDIPENESRHF